MKENLHIDEAVSQEVEKSSFPYQEAHWEALAAQMSTRPAWLQWWPQAAGIVILAGIALGLWRPWQQNLPPYMLSPVAQLKHSISIEESAKGAEINFISLRKQAVLPTVEGQSASPLVEKENPFRQLEIVDTLEMLEKDQKRIAVEAVERVAPEMQPASMEPGRSPRLPDRTEIAPWKKWSMRMWAAPSLVYRNLRVLSDDPNAALNAAIWDSVTSYMHSNANGVQIERLVKKRWAISLGMNLTEMGWELMNDSLTFSQPEPGDPYAIHYSYHFNYLEAELGVNYHIKRTRPAIYTKASISPALLSNGRSESTILYREWEPSTTVNNDFGEGFNRFNLFGSLGAGIVWPGQGRINLMVEPTITYGLLPVENGASWNTSLFGMQLRSGLVIKW